MNPDARMNPNKSERLFKKRASLHLNFKRKVYLIRMGNDEGPLFREIVI